MSNRRMIDSRTRSSENFASLSYRQRDLWHGLIVSADDQGRMMASPAYVRSLVWPYDDISLQDVEDDLKAIEAVGSLLIYKVGGKKYLQLVNWWKYQQGQWACKSDFPSPDGWTDRCRYHVRGNEIVEENWKLSGGFDCKQDSPQTRTLDSTLDSHQDSNTDSRERREENDEDDDDDERSISAAPPPKQPRTAESYKKELAEAMQRGFENNLNMETRVEKAFNITPNWHTKTNRAVMLFLKARPKEETIEKFKEWWYHDDWRGKTGQPPTLPQIQELWPQAFKDGGGDHKDYAGGEFADIVNRDADEAAKIKDDFYKLTHKGPDSVR